MYEVQRTVFDSIVKKYEEYLALYKRFNNGSLEGATPFDVFYWRFSYYVRYDDPQTSVRSGY